MERELLFVLLANEQVVTEADLTELRNRGTARGKSIVVLEVGGFDQPDTNWLSAESVRLPVVGWYGVAPLMSLERITNLQQHFGAWDLHLYVCGDATVPPLLADNTTLLAA